MALSFGDQTAYTGASAAPSLTFAQWDADASRLARGLLEAGVEPGRPGGHPPRAGQRPALDRGLCGHPPGRGGGRAAQPAADPARGRAHDRALRRRGPSSPRSRSSTGTRAAGRRWWWPFPRPETEPRTPIRRRDPAGPRRTGRPAWSELIDNDPGLLPGATGAGRPGRHPLHLGHHRSSQGGGRPPRQLLAGPLRRAGMERWRLDARQPALHLRRALLRLHPDEARHARALPAQVRRRAVARRRRGGATGGRLPGPGHGQPAPRATRASTPRRSIRCRSAPWAAPRWPRSSWSGCRSGCPRRWSPTTTG